MTGALAVVAPRIGQLIRLLGSDRDGEVLAAARALGRTLATVGQDFHALADTIELSVERSPAVHHHYDHHHEYADHRATARQEGWLLAIYERAASESRRA